MPILRNPETILIGKKAFFQAGKKTLQKALLNINIKPKPLYINSFNHYYNKLIKIKMITHPKAIINALNRVAKLIAKFIIYYIFQ